MALNRKCVVLLDEDQLMNNGTAAARNTLGNINDFDFLVGSWNIVNRRLVKRGVKCTDWDVFPATYHCRQYLHGVANVDEMIVPSKGFSGMTLRSFNVIDRQWAIYWINSKSGVLCPPVHGGFDGDRGDFFGEDTDDGKAVQVHFVWQRFGANQARWHQAFLRDGRAWEINWIMEFTRASVEISS
jgi:hypothetical protein